MRRSADSRQWLGVAATSLCLCLCAAEVRGAEVEHRGVGTDQPPDRADLLLRGLPEEQLKRLYLDCSDAALGGALGSEGIAFCSMAYETLLRRVFQGDFVALLAWSRRQPARQVHAGRAPH